MSHLDKIQQKKLQETRELEMFGGVTSERLNAEIEKWEAMTPPDMMAMSLLSDVQEMVSHLDADEAVKEKIRTTLNRAKYFLRPNR